MPLSPLDCLRSLRSLSCPACGREKRTMQTFCQWCWAHIPMEHRPKLYRRIRDGYEEAMEVCLYLLGKDGISIQDEESKSPPLPKSAPPPRGLFDNS